MVMRRGGDKGGDRQYDFSSTYLQALLACEIVQLGERVITF